MSRNKHAAKKHKYRRENMPSSNRLPSGLRDRLAEANRLIERGRRNEAREILEELDRQSPRNVELLGALVNLYYELNDIPAYQFACERLLPLTPHHRDLPLMLAGAYLTNARPALAAKMFRQFLDRWEGDPRAANVRHTLGDLEVLLKDALKDMGLSGPDAMESARMHEEVQSFLEQGQFDRVCQRAQELLSKQPDFVPALNNMSQALFHLGRLDEAIAATRRVLDAQPDNYHAVSNLARYLCLAGEIEEAKALGERLKTAPIARLDLWVKTAEALAILGDDQGVLDTLAAAKGDSDFPKGGSNSGLLCHLAAVAAMRLGQEAEARKLWKKALELDPRQSLAAENLEDLKKPVSERHAPWPYECGYWLPRAVFARYIERIRAMDQNRAGIDKRAGKETVKTLQELPLLANVVPLLLEHGDPAGRELAFTLAKLAKTPPMLAALREFALGQRGPDMMRYNVASFLEGEHAWPSGPVRLWIQGEWKDILLLAFEIHEEISRVHTPEVEELGGRALDALYDGDGKTAERLLKQALEIEPGQSTLMNNLVAAYQAQGRKDEADRLVDEIYQRDPDYFFVRIQLAHRHIDAKKLDEAREMLDPLLRQQRLHKTEFIALCAAEIQYCLAQGEHEGAKKWLDMWEPVDPDSPQIKRLRETMPLLEAVYKLANYSPRKRKRK